MLKLENFSVWKSMTKITLVLIMVLIAVGCSNARISGDRKLHGSEIPTFMQKYQSKEYVKPEFYEKSYTKHKSYEVKYLENGNEVSLAIYSVGKLIEKEVDTDMNGLPPGAKEKIIAYIKNKYPGYLILEVELRQENQEEDFIDVEIRHKSSRSGYWELTFTPDGEYVSREVEVYKSLETLN